MEHLLNDEGRCVGCPDCEEFEEEIAGIDAQYESGVLTEDEVREQYRVLGVD